jgi:hypothetical protein
MQWTRGHRHAWWRAREPRAIDRERSGIDYGLGDVSPYEVLCRCADSLRGAGAVFGAYDDRCLVEDREVLATARSHLGPNVAVSLTESPDDVLVTLRLFPLAHAIRAEAHQHRTEKRRREATEAGLDLLRLANVMRRGGLIADLLLSLRVESMAFNVLRALRMQWRGSECEDVVAAIAVIQSEREQYSEITRRDREWESRHLRSRPSPTFEQRLKEWKITFGANDKCAHLLDTFMPGAVLQQRFHLEQRGIAMARLLCCEAAIAIERSQGKSPNTIPVHHLPSFLLAVDPFSSKQLVFRSSGGDGHLLYSVGPTGIDHHGHFGSWAEIEKGTADLCLDYENYEPE